MRSLGGALPWVLLGLLLLVHFPLRHSQYIQDDHLAVEKNRIVARGDLGQIFTTSYWAGAEGDDKSLYRPVVILSYALERRLGQDPDPFVSQVVNLLLHALTSLAVLLLVRRVGAGEFVAGASALLFALHPVHSEAVANIVGRAEILSTVFSLLALVALSHAGPWQDKRPSASRARFASWGAGILFFLALGSKETSLATLPLLVMLELGIRPLVWKKDLAPRRWIEALTALAPCALALLIYLWMRAHALELLFSIPVIHPADNLLVRLEGVDRRATALGLLARYAMLLVYPIRLSADYSGTVIGLESSLFSPRPFIAMILLTLLVALALLPWAGRRRLEQWRLTPGLGARLGLAAALFLLPYLVIGNLLRNVGTVFAERLIYFPSVGFCFLLAMLLGGLSLTLPRPLRRSPWFPGASIAMLLLIAYGTRTWARCLDWRDDRTLFTAATRSQPKSPRSHFILGKLDAMEGRQEAALERFERTVELYPDYLSAWFEKGVILAQRERFPEALELFRRCRTINPAYVPAHLNEGMTLRRLGADAAAERALKRALLWDPDSVKGWSEIGNLYLGQRKFASAAEAYRRGIALGNRDLEPRLKLAEKSIRRGAS